MNNQTVTKMKDKELLRLYKELDQLVNVDECFGSRDVLLFELAGRELDKRGL